MVSYWDTYEDYRGVEKPSNSYFVGIVVSDTTGLFTIVILTRIMECFLTGIIEDIFLHSVNIVLLVTLT